jgi:hypothetical protein
LERRVTATRPAALVIPELGPSFGRLVAPPPPPPGSAPPWIPLDDLRLTLVSQLFELAGDARRWAAEGDRELALATLNREAWNGAWQRTVHGVAERAAAAVNERLLAAAAEARLPKRRARALVLDEAEVRALAGRLAIGTPAFDQALAALDRAVHQVRSNRAPVDAVAFWQESLMTAARRLESAWLALEEALTREWRDWGIELEEIRAWRRPLWPLAIFGAVLILLFGYAGLVLGGYLPVPDPVRGIVEAIWDRWS